MFSSKLHRKLAIVSLLVILTVFFIWYGSLEPEPDRGDHPGGEHIIGDYEMHIGEKVEVGGEVIEEEPLRIEVEHGDQKIVLTIIDSEETVGRKDRVTVYGTLREGNVIECKNLVVRPYWNWIYMYAVSGVAAVWVGIRLLKQWKWDRENWTFEQRRKPLESKKLIKGEKRG